jgi:hypothetical protein
VMMVLPASLVLGFFSLWQDVGKIPLFVFGYNHAPVTIFNVKVAK